jgi:hypothetical protein
MKSFLYALAVTLIGLPLCADSRLSRAEYQDRIHAAWTAQILGTLMGFEFEHKPASTIFVDKLPDRFQMAPVDDDYYYELVAIRAFEKYGIGMTVADLGKQWIENSAGSWGSSEQARLLLARGIRPPETGHPRYNRMWFSIGPQFSADVYGMLAPGMPNLAGKLAREFGHINGYSVGTDGAVFMAGMVSMAFTETNPKEIVRKAARLLHPKSPYRQCLDMVIAMAEKGATPEEIANAVEDRWHIEYPATNNAVANGGLVALSVWFGEGDFLQTVNHAYRAADFTDADCNAANAAAVVGALKGMKALPPNLVARLQDRIRGSQMGGVKLTPPVDESITGIAKRTAALGVQFLKASGGALEGDTLRIPAQQVITQAPELFELGDLMQYWNSDWKLLRAGFGGAGGGMRGLRGITYLDGDVLATYPRDEVRAVVITRTAKLSAQPKLSVDAGANAGESWTLEVYANNKRLLNKPIEGSAPGLTWQKIEVSLEEFANQTTHLRLFQRVLVPGRVSGNAYWRNLQLN